MLIENLPVQHKLICLVKYLKPIAKLVRNKRFLLRNKGNRVPQRQTLEATLALQLHVEVCWPRVELPHQCEDPIIPWGDLLDLGQQSFHQANHLHLYTTSPRTGENCSDTVSDGSTVLAEGETYRCHPALTTVWTVGKPKLALQSDIHSIRQLQMDHCGQQFSLWSC